jgi:tyrosyl-tRNA synthetase
VNRDPNAQLSALKRGTVTLNTGQELEAKLKRSAEQGIPLRVKLGVDPSAPDIHLGHTVVLRKLRQFQDMGHQAVLIIGDFTALVGDPTGRKKTRPQLSPNEVEVNAKTYLDQVGRILAPERLEVVRNSGWLKPLPFYELIGLSAKMTVARFLERDDFTKRHKEGTPIFLHEFLYLVMQAYDSVIVKADVELGGTDQTFNLGVGRRLMEQMGMEPQVSLIGPLVEGPDGSAKMSKSLGNSIGLDDPPGDVFGMAMRIGDVLLPKYLRLLTDLPDADIDALEKDPPMERKLRMAEALVARYHGAARGKAVREEWLKVHRHGETPTEMPDVAVGPPGEDGRWWIVDLLKTAGFAPNTSEARRLVEGGAVHLADDPVPDWRARLVVKGGEVLRVGRRRHARLVLAGGAR